MESIHHGSCGCGKVRFETKLDLDKGATRCNCGLCIKIHPSSSMVKPADFGVTAGEELLTTFQRTSYPMFRRFCGQCGTQVYGFGNLPELGGDFVAVNVQCLDGVEVDQIAIKYWDGRHDNWQAGPRERPWAILTQA